MTDKHKIKVKLAKRMMSELDKKAHRSPFHTTAWDKRKEDRAERVKTRQAKAHSRAMARKDEKKTKLCIKEKKQK
jgi:hypothetical protein